MSGRAPTRRASEVHGEQETAAQGITQECTEVHVPEVHAPDPLFRGGGQPERFEPTDWEARLAERTAEYRRRRDAQDAGRAEFRRRRNYGLAKRHARKLYDNRQEKQP